MGRDDDFVVRTKVDFIQSYGAMDRQGVLNILFYFYRPKGLRLMDIQERLHHFIVEDIVTDNKSFTLRDSPNLIEDGIIDSLGIMKLLNFIEHTFRIHVSDTELIPENFETIEAISTLIANKIDSR